MNRVASEAGVSRATVYRRFGNAEGLRSALMEERGASSSLDRVGVRARILDAALTEFTRAGVHGATIRGIADSAGVSPMTVYNHFNDKEGLVVALFSGRGPSSLLSRDIADSETFEATISAFVVGVLEIARNQRDFFGLIFAPDPITRRAFQRMRGRADDAGTTLASILDATGLPPEIGSRVAATSLMGMIIANCVLRPLLFGDDVEDPAALAEQIWHIVVHNWLFHVRMGTKTFPRKRSRPAKSVLERLQPLLHVEAVGPEERLEPVEAGLQVIEVLFECLAPRFAVAMT